MFERVSQLRDAMQHFATGLDAALIEPADAARVVQHAAAIEKMAAAVKVMAAARVAETSLWRNKGDRSPAHQLARATGSSVAAAADALEAAQKFDSQPAVAAAARRGDLSMAQAALITDAVAADPDAEQLLVDAAGRVSVGELRDECARIKAAAEPDPEGKRRAIHNERSLRTYTDRGGAFNLHMRDNPEVGAEIMAALGPIRDRLFNEARKEGRRESMEAYGADALLELARGAVVKTGRTKLIARFDLSALLRGYPVTGETCEIVGFGPVAVSAIRDLIDSGDPFLTAVATDGKQVLAVAHLGRRPTAFQQTALEWMYPDCAAEGCSALAFLENDHRDDWAKTHMTILDVLDRLCGHHHDLKTRENWSLVEGRGKRAFVNPDDPRHPRHATSANANANAPPAQDAA
jgi:hypothetical protein